MPKNDYPRIIKVDNDDVRHLGKVFKNILCRRKMVNDTEELEKELENTLDEALELICKNIDKFKLNNIFYKGEDTLEEYKLTNIEECIFSYGDNIFLTIEQVDCKTINFCMEIKNSDTELKYVCRTYDLDKNGRPIEKNSELNPREKMYYKLAKILWEKFLLLQFERIKNKNKLLNDFLMKKIGYLKLITFGLKWGK